MMKPTFDQVVTFRVAFAARRRELLAMWLVSHEVQSNSVGMWAQRLEEANDAEMAFAKLVDVLEVL